MKYLVLCNRHNSIFGKEWALFWGNRESKSDYTSDVRVAHRFNESEIVGFDDNEDIPIPIDILGISEEYIDESKMNKNLRVIIEKRTINKLLDLNLKEK